MPEVRPIREPLPVLARSREPEWLLRRYAAERDPALLEELVTRFRPLVTKLALRYVRTSESLEDLEQVGAMGLVKAIERFDPDRGYAFTSFAVPTILGEIKRSIRATAWSAHVPRPAWAAPRPAPQGGPRARPAPPPRPPPRGGRGHADGPRARRAARVGH